jgi:hypothetical protein
MDELNALRLEAAEIEIMLEQSHHVCAELRQTGIIPPHFQGTILDYCEFVIDETVRIGQLLYSTRKRIEELKWKLVGPRFVGYVRSMIWDSNMKDARKSIFLSIYS